MKGSEHLGLSLLSGGLLFIPLLPPSPGTYILLFSGLFIGSMAPDADIRRSPVNNQGGFSPLTSIFMYAIRYLIYYPASLVFMAIYGKRCTPRHRGLLHSLPGITIMSVIIALFLLACAGYCEIYLTEQILIFIVAFFCGALIHLAADTCTLTGIGWLFPLSRRRLSGSIRTGEKTDIRPLLYLCTLGLAGLFILFLPVYGVVADDIYPYSGIILLPLLWLIFFISADVR
ncbi:hypothetical protein RJ53_06460 [Methanocalculus chunghsingensis]|uniref:Metal-dependent hydrolase n=1 Tax=Methanocalculus chunghsingensis TaxID=156457 RepID=A0A8J7W6C7_9EURY|nr:metal-dependent hydrolase [Methanocalculus chunghsingensis]MBR1369151.1 hypothetical protein [Methanocalculus chunghsingensis]